MVDVANLETRSASTLPHKDWEQMRTRHLNLHYSAPIAASPTAPLTNSPKASPSPFSSLSRACLPVMPSAVFILSRKPFAAGLSESSIFWRVAHVYPHLEEYIPSPLRGTWVPHFSRSLREVGLWGLS